MTATSSPAHGHPLQTRAEILKLARLLGRDPDEFIGLSDVPPADVRMLREQITEVLFNAHGATLGRLAAASKLLPGGVVAAIAQRAFGPVLSARVAGLLEPERAVEMATRLPIAFLADIATEIDPRRSNQLIAQIPAAQVADVTRELLARGEQVTMGRFVGHLNRDAIAAAVAEMDDASVLQVAFVMEEKEALPEIVDLLPPERHDAIIRAAAEGELWPEVLDLITHLHPAQTVTFAGLPGLLEDGVLEGIVAVAREYELWPGLLPLVPHLEPPALERVGAIVGSLGLSEEELARLCGAGEDARLRPGLELLLGAAGLSGRPRRGRSRASRSRSAPG